MSWETWFRCFVIFLAAFVLVLCVERDTQGDRGSIIVE